MNAELETDQRSGPNVAAAVVERARIPKTSGDSPGTLEAVS